MAVRPSRPSGRGRPCRSCRSPLPSRCAAMPMMAADGDDAGTAHAGDDAVPGGVDRGDLRIGDRLGQRFRRSPKPSPFFGLAPCTVTKDGQKPFTQEKSLLQLDWSIWRLRPYSVSSGCTATQFDLDRSNHRSPRRRARLMITRLSGSGNCAPLAAAALFRGAGLVVDHHRDAADLRKLTLHALDFVAMVDRHAGGEIPLSTGISPARRSPARCARRPRRGPAGRSCRR